MKYGRGDLVADADVATLPPGASPAPLPEAVELTDDLERLGPTYVK